MAAVVERNRDAADRIKALMFTFEDLARLEAGAIQTLIQKMDKRDLSIALKGASETVKDVFFAPRAPAR